MISGPEQAHDVAEDREAEAREDLLGDGGAAEDVALLEDEGLHPGAGEVGRADEAVVAATDDDRVVGLGQGMRPPRLSRLHTFDASLADADAASRRRSPPSGARPDARRRIDRCRLAERCRRARSKATHQSRPFGPRVAGPEPSGPARWLSSGPRVRGSSPRPRRMPCRARRMPRSCWARYGGAERRRRPASRAVAPDRAISVISSRPPRATSRAIDSGDRRDRRPEAPSQQRTPRERGR